jgi:hypothetical protein
MGAQKEPTYRVVGVRANGERITISKHATRQLAERVVNLIRTGTDFKEILIEDEKDKPVAE